MTQEYKNIDDLLRGSLEAYSKEPSPGVWNKISAGLLFRSSWIYLSIALILITSGALLILQSGPVSTQTSQLTSPEQGPLNQHEPSKTQQGVSSIAQLDHSTTKTYKSEKTSTVVAQPDIKSASKPGPAIANNPESKYLVNDPSVSRSTPSDSPVQPEANHFFIYPGLERIQSEYTIANYKQDVFFVTHGPTYPSIISLRTAHGSAGRKNDYTLSRDHSLMFQLNPELIYSGEENKDIFQAMNFDLSYVIEGRGGFIQAGLGLGFTRSKGQFDIYYDQYDSIGFYEQVDYFYIDPGTGQPAFATSTEGVFDTVGYATTENSQNLYYYLRIPVLAGLKFYEFRRISLYAEAGATYAALIKASEPGTEFQNDEATRVEIVDNSPARIQSNVQLSLGLGLKYQLNRNFDLRIDGMYNYYWDAISTRSMGEKAPYSFGMRIGILYKL